MPARIDDETYLARIRAIHGDTYTFTGVVTRQERGRPVRSYTGVCPKHGDFTVSVRAALRGCGCTACGYEKVSESKRKSKEEYIKEATKLHNGRYEYTDVTYEPKAVFHAICPKHGPFKQAADTHLSGHACPPCGYELQADKTSDTFEDIVNKARSTHGDRYEYLNQVKEGSINYLLISCPTHGEFLQRASSHVYGLGCPKCAADRTSDRRKVTDESWFSRATKVHGDRYLYNSVIRSRNEVTRLSIDCKKHGNFVQIAKDHLNGSGCPTCGDRITKPNQELSQFLTDLSVVHELEFRIPNNRQYLDLFVPEAKFAVELHGIYWHSEEYRSASYHADKHKAAAKAGIRILHVFDDEWNSKQEIVKRAIAQALQVSKEVKVGARKCQVVTVAAPQAKAFFNAWHIQGFAPATAYIGLQYKGELVALSAFSMKERGRSGRKSADHSELVRYATACSVPGGMSRLIEAAQKQLGFSVCTTFSDIRFFSGASYAAVGFKEIGRLRPDYFYAKGGKRVHKSNLQKSRFKAQGLLYDPTYTESQLAELNGFKKVWDCGKVVWQKSWAASLADLEQQTKTATQQQVRT